MTAPELLVARLGAAVGAPSAPKQLAVSCFGEFHLRKLTEAGRAVGVSTDALNVKRRLSEIVAYSRPQTERDRLQEGRDHRASLTTPKTAG
jgi:hypothetical protein